MYRNLFISTFIILFAHNVKCQEPFSLKYFGTLTLENHFYNSEFLFSQSLRGLSYFPNNKNIFIDSLVYSEIYNNYNPQGKSWFSRKLFYENLFDKDSSSIHLEVNPELNLILKKSFDQGESLYTNTRGVRLYLNIHDRLFITSNFYENQSHFPDYINSFIREYRVVPGHARPRGFKNLGHDYYWAIGKVVYKPNEYNILLAGHGKQFVGNGYRSHLLSDVAFNYPHIQYVHRSSLFQYSKTLALLRSSLVPVQDISPGQEKTAVFHNLATQLSEKLEIGLFEGNIVSNPDSSGNYSFYVGYVNPVPVLNSFLPYNNIETHSVIGFNLNYRPSHLLNLYGQLAFDDPFENSNSVDITNKWGGQVGIKVFEPFQIDNLILNSELNVSAPYSYGDKNPRLSYSHYNQPLAHPFGANFIENVNWLFYRKKRFAFQAEVLFARYGTDKDGAHFGKNIDRSLAAIPTDRLNPNRFIQGEETRLFYMDLQCSWIINPAYDLKVFVSYQARKETSASVNYVNSWIGIGMKTRVVNSYFDF